MGKRFVYGTNPSVPDYMFVPSTGHTFKFVTDHLGSPVEIIDVNTGAVAEEIHYDDFGNVTSDSNPGFQPFRFARGLYDIETKLCQFGARQYDPSIGRWLTKDPILFDGGDTNLYGYVVQDPVNRIDPPGTGPIADGIVAGLCATADAYDVFRTLNIGAKITSTVSSLQSSNRSLQHQLDSQCITDDRAAKIRSFMAENNAAMAQLAKLYGSSQFPGMSSMGFNSIGAAASAAAFLVGGI